MGELGKKLLFDSPSVYIAVKPIIRNHIFYLDILAASIVMKKGFSFLLLIFCGLYCLAQSQTGKEIRITVQTDSRVAIHSATVTVMKPDS